MASYQRPPVGAAGTSNSHSRHTALASCRLAPPVLMVLVPRGCLGSPPVCLRRFRRCSVPAGGVHQHVGYTRAAVCG